MISGVKRFGSFVRTDFEERAEEGEEVPGGCAIPAAYTALPLLSRRKYSHDVGVFEFGLPAGRTQLNLPAGCHLLVRLGSEEDPLVRPYSAVALGEPEGSFCLLVKRYDEWGVPESAGKNLLLTRTDHSYRPPGRASTRIHRMRVGDTLEFKFSAQCVGRARFPFPGVSSITMVCVGIGIVPMVGIVEAFARQAEGWTAEISILYGAVSGPPPDVIDAP